MREEIGRESEGEGDSNLQEEEEEEREPRLALPSHCCLSSRTPGTLLGRQHYFTAFLWNLTSRLLSAWSPRRKTHGLINTVNGHVQNGLTTG